MISPQVFVDSCCAIFSFLCSVFSFWPLYSMSVWFPVGIFNLSFWFFAMELQSESFFSYRQSKPEFHLLMRWLLFLSLTHRIRFPSTSQLCQVHHLSPTWWGYARSEVIAHESVLETQCLFPVHCFNSSIFETFLSYIYSHYGFAKYIITFFNVLLKITIVDSF